MSAEDGFTLMLLFKRPKALFLAPSRGILHMSLAYSLNHVLSKTE